MTQILLNLKDPSWWFSTIFIAIVASVVAGFAKDRIGEFAAHFSNRLRLRQERISKQRQKRISSLVENETLLIIVTIQSGIGAIFFFLTVIMFILSPMWVELMNNWCSAASLDPTCKIDHRPLGIISTLVFGFLSAFTAFKSMSGMSLTSDAIRAYRKKHSTNANKA